MGTVSYTERTATPLRMSPCAHLFVALEGGRPLAGGARHRLDGVREAAIGRGTGGRDAQRSKRGGSESLRIEVPDERMSSSHARLFHADGGWHLEDTDSKNGSFVNGVRRARTLLCDGDVVRLGHTLFVYRAALPTGPESPADLDIGGVIPPLATLNPALGRALDLLARAATSPVPVLVLGETGTGKEVCARAIHAMSRRQGDFVPVNCGALPPALVESELFGFRRGAFSGAVADHAGLVRGAEGGTLLLDEIGDLPLPAQAALLRVLQESEILPLGATRPTKIDLRVVAATHRDLAARVRKGEFREDLLARLSGFTLDLPALRERREDIGLLVAALLRRWGASAASGITLRPEVAEALVGYAWPRNVRELEKTLGRALAVRDGAILELHHLPDDVRAAAEEWAEQAARAGDGGPAENDAGLRERLRAALAHHHGNVSLVARQFTTSRTQIHRWASRFELDLDAFRR